MSEQLVPHRLKGMRKAWGLTQSELATLLGGRSSAHLSRVERADRCPTVCTVIASSILFGRSIEYLFKGLYDAVEDMVLREAYLLEERLITDDRPKAKRKRELLSQAMQAIIDRHKSASV